MDGRLNGIHSWARCRGAHAENWTPIIQPVSSHFTDSHILPQMFVVVLPGTLKKLSCLLCTSYDALHSTSLCETVHSKCGHILAVRFQVHQSWCQKNITFLSWSIHSYTCCKFFQAIRHMKVVFTSRFTDCLCLQHQELMWWVVQLHLYLYPKYLSGFSALLLYCWSSMGLSQVVSSQSMLNKAMIF